MIVGQTPGRPLQSGDERKRFGRAVRPIKNITKPFAVASHVAWYNCAKRQMTPQTIRICRRAETALDRLIEETLFSLFESREIFQEACDTRDEDYRRVLWAEAARWQLDAASMIARAERDQPGSKIEICDRLQLSQVEHSRYLQVGNNTRLFDNLEGHLSADIEVLYQLTAISPACFKAGLEQGWIDPSVSLEELRAVLKLRYRARGLCHRYRFAHMKFSDLIS